MNIVVNLGESNNYIYVWILKKEVYDKICEANGGEIESYAEWAKFTEGYQEDLKEQYPTEFANFAISGTFGESGFRVDIDDETTYTDYEFFYAEDDYDCDDIDDMPELPVVIGDYADGGKPVWGLLNRLADDEIAFILTEITEPGVSVEFDLDDTEQFDPRKLIIRATEDEEEEVILTDNVFYNGEKIENIDNSDNGPEYNRFLKFVPSEEMEILDDHFCAYDCHEDDEDEDF